jgi:uncharacterized SAM-binding protein YcdF (DUF218 family)
VLAALQAGRAPLILALLVACLALLWGLRAPLLTGAASLWIVSDEMSAADAIVVLGGGLDTRPAAAAQLYKRGLAPRILIADTDSGPTGEAGTVSGHTAANRAALIKLGIPQEAIQLFGRHPSSTYEEARALEAWAAATGARRVVVPTEIFVTRRARWIIDRQLAAVGARVSVYAVAPRGFDRTNWWRHAQGVVSFQTEVLKYLYYRLSY